VKNLMSKTKVCGNCNKRKPRKAFHKLTEAKDGLNYYCKACQNAKNKLCWPKYYRAHKKRLLAEDKKMYHVRQEELDKMKAQPCMDCGGRFPACAMDFDHVRGKKKFVLSAIGGHNWNKVLKEAKKCDVVCANCHRIRTTRRRNE
jgi:hypothetical protein